MVVFPHSVIHRQHFTGGRNHWVKRLVREVIFFLFPWTGVRLGLW